MKWNYQRLDRNSTSIVSERIMTANKDETDIQTFDKLTWGWNSIPWINLLTKQVTITSRVHVLMLEKLRSLKKWSVSSLGYMETCQALARNPRLRSHKSFQMLATNTEQQYRPYISFYIVFNCTHLRFSIKNAYFFCYFNFHTERDPRFKQVKRFKMTLLHQTHWK